MEDEENASTEAEVPVMVMDSATIVDDGSKLELVIEDGVVDTESAQEEVGEDVEVEPSIVLREGDIFVYSNTLIAMSILAIIGSGYKVRLYSAIADSFVTSEEKVLKYIRENGLIKLNTRRDQMEEVAKALVFSVGDVFTKDGKAFVEILTDEMLYIDQFGDSKYIIGMRDANDLVTHRDELEIKSMVFGNSDQFPSAQ